MQALASSFSDKFSICFTYFSALAYRRVAVSISAYDVKIKAAKNRKNRYFSVQDPWFIRKNNQFHLEKFEQ